MSTDRTEPAAKHGIAATKAGKLPKASVHIEWVIDKLKTHVWMAERAPDNSSVLPTGAQMKQLINRLEIAKRLL